MPVERRQLDSFSPDSDPISKDIVFDDNGFYPIIDGYKVMPGLIAITPALPNTCLGSFVGSLGSGFPFIVAGTISDLYVLEAGNWVAQNIDMRSDLAPPDRWRFTQYGVDIIAVNGQDQPFVSRNGGAFRDLGGNPPIAGLAAATDNSLFLIRAESFQWFSSLSDEIWNLSIATQTVAADLTGTPGPIIAARAIRGGIALYKRNALHAAFFSGPSFFYDFNRISDTVGVPSNETVVQAGDYHYFWGEDNFYRFDGYNLVQIPNRLRRFFLGDMNRRYDYLIWGRWDEDRSLVVWHYSSNSGNGLIDSWICFNTQTGEWGAGRLTVEAVLNGLVTVFQGLTYDQFGAMHDTYDDIPAMPYDDPSFGASGELLAGVFLGDHRLYAYQGPPTNAYSYLTSGDFGDRKTLLEIRRVRPGWTLNPGAGISQCEVLTQYLQGTPPTLLQTVPQSYDGWYNVHTTSRLQRFRFRVFGPDLLIDNGGGGSGALTYDQFGALEGYYNNIPGIPYNAPLFQGEPTGPSGAGSGFGDAEISDMEIEYEVAGDV